MARKEKSRQRVPKRRDEKPVVFSPFRDLKKMLAERAKALPPAPKQAVAQTDRDPLTAPKPVDEEALLREALAGVRPLNGASRLPLERRASRAIVSEDDE